MVHRKYVFLWGVGVDGTLLTSANICVRGGCAPSEGDFFCFFNMKWCNLVNILSDNSPIKISILTYLVIRNLARGEATVPQDLHPWSCTKSSNLTI